MSDDFLKLKDFPADTRCKPIRGPYKDDVVKVLSGHSSGFGNAWLVVERISDGYKFTQRVTDFERI